MSDAPRLSVVMPMRDCGHCICAMLDSLLATKIPMQIIIVDDASEDDGTARVEAWSQRTGQPVELLRNDGRLYSYGSRLKGLARATAPVIWCVDADDIIPANANVCAALAIMEKDRPDILHGKACGVAPGGGLQKPLLWTEPVAESLSGGEIFRAFLAQSYPPATLCNKFFSARLVRDVLDIAPALEVRYFDVKFLGLLFLLRAQSYAACNELVYEYRMRAHRPAWLYARQVNALLLLETSLAPLVAKYAPEQAGAFLAYCRRRQIIQAGHLCLMAEAELKRLVPDKGRADDWLNENILPNISPADLILTLRRSLCGNAARLYGFGGEVRRLLEPDGTLPAKNSSPPAPEFPARAARDWLGGNFARAGLQLGAYGLALGLDFAKNAGAAEKDRKFAGGSFWREAVALLLANAQLARAVTAIMAPEIDITQKAN